MQVLLRSLYFLLLVPFVAFGDGVTHLVFEPNPEVKAKGKHIVLISGDEEYRSEETCPMLGKVLSQIHGYKCTVLFPINPEGYIDPNFQKNIPGLEALKAADLMIIGTRFRDLPDDQLKHIYDYLKAGKPVIGFRTATHAFKTKSRLGGFNWNKFGEEVLGTGWVSHHGKHKVQGCLGIHEAVNKAHSILRDVDSFFSMADVYGVNLKRVNPENATILLRGAVTHNLERKSSPVGGGKNDPMMPIAWLRKYQIDGGKEGVAFATTAGSSVDFRSESRELALFVNAVHHLMGFPSSDRRRNKIKDRWRPTFYGFNSKKYYKSRNLKVADFALGKGVSTGLEKPKSSPLWRPESKVKRKKYPRLKYDQPAKPKSAAAKVVLPYHPEKGESIVFIGNSLAERFSQFNHFETQLHEAMASKEVKLRNMGFPGDTAGLRPRAGRNSQWAFPGAEKFHPQYRSHIGRGHEPNPDEWLTICKADTILACFGYNESFAGPAGVENFKAELRAFADHSKKQAYNGKTAPRLILVSPVAFEDRRDTYDLPSGEAENKNLALYTAAMKEVAEEKEVGFVDLFNPTMGMLRQVGLREPLTLNGCHWSDAGYRQLAPVLLGSLFAVEQKRSPVEVATNSKLYQAVKSKNWIWKNDYRILNGVHVYGSRYNPYGNYNYPEELEKLRQMAVLRDQKIWDIANQKTAEVAVDDSKTRPLSKTPTNYRYPTNYVAPEESMKQFKLPKGYKVELFASEREFPDLQNPGQMAFDDKGRLWVAVCPSYPHYQPGDHLPNDKLLIYEDTNGDGLADKQTVFADGLHLPFGFEFAPGGGVYTAEQPYLTLLEDLDGDDKMDKRTVLLDGFDPHDTHHAFSAFCADASGAILMPEGRFLHTQIETPYGVERAVDGGVWRFQPKTWRVEHISQTDYSNPWGIIFNEYGQSFIADASGGTNWHLLPLSMRLSHGREIAKAAQFTTLKMRPTAGAELLYSRHFEKEMWGDFLLGNSIGFLGIKQQTVETDNSSYTGRVRQDFIKSFDPNVRACDLEVAPDGSVYFVDWHNVLIGHMQHAARDPKRDNKHGRIYRIHRPNEPLIKPAKIVGASLDELFENLKLPEYRSRYRTRRAIATFPAEKVIAKAEAWVKTLDKKNPRYGIYLLEGLWTTWAQNRLSPTLLDQALNSSDYRVRAGAMRVVKYSRNELSHSADIMVKASRDEHAQVRLEALTAASWLDDKDRLSRVQILANVLEAKWDNWARHCVKESYLQLSKDIRYAVENGQLDLDKHPGLVRYMKQMKAPKIKKKEAHELAAEKLPKAERASFLKGYEVYHRDAHCSTCHQAKGEGIANVYPPLVGSEWVVGSKQRLIKLTLHGLMGPIEVAGKKYTGQVPMTPFGGILSDDKEIAAVLNYVRNSWGNKASVITAAEVKAAREATKDQQGFFSPEQLLKEHPMKKK